MQPYERFHWLFVFVDWFTAIFIPSLYKMSPFHLTFRKDKMMKIKPDEWHGLWKCFWSILLGRDFFFFFFFFFLMSLRPSLQLKITVGCVLLCRSRALGAILMEFFSKQSTWKLKIISDLIISLHSFDSLILFVLLWFFIYYYSKSLKWNAPVLTGCPHW